MFTLTSVLLWNTLRYTERRELRAVRRSLQVDVDSCRAYLYRHSVPVKESPTPSSLPLESRYNNALNLFRRSPHLVGIAPARWYEFIPQLIFSAGCNKSVYSDGAEAEELCQSCY